MILHVTHTSSLSGVVTPPSSKSQTVRALLFALLCEGASVVRNILASDDTDAALECIQALGARVEIEKTSGGITNALVTGNGVPVRPRTSRIVTGNSGITTRFVLPLLGLTDGSIIFELDCGEQMRSRPIEPLVGALRSLGMTIEPANANENFPLRVSGALGSGSVSIDGTTSQYLSALLLSLPLVQGRSEIVVCNLNERPYVEMTTHWLDVFGVSYTWTREGMIDHIALDGGSRYPTFDRRMPGDFSSASALIAAGVLVPGTIKLEGLDMSDAQGDKRLVSIVKEMGADVSVDGATLIIHGGRDLSGMKIDCNDIPDLVPALSVIATAAKGVTELVNVPQARLKETDRIHSMATELSKMGARITELEDGLRIEQSELTGTSIHGWDDHRTVMALAVAGLIARGETAVDTSESVSKTYPNFVRDMQALGALMGPQGPSIVAPLGASAAKRKRTREARNRLPVGPSGGHVILIGFKHVGKTKIGRILAERAGLPFVDMDTEIESSYARDTGRTLSCREIMREIGKFAFRALESDLFSEILNRSGRYVIATGGGISLDKDGEVIRSKHKVIHITCDKDTVFERIVKKGKPAFFSDDRPMRETFDELWDLRMPIFHASATHTVSVGKTPEETVSEILGIL